MSRNLLISLEIRSLLSSSMSMVFMSSCRQRKHRLRKEKKKRAGREEGVTSGRKKPTGVREPQYLFLFLFFPLSPLGVFILRGCVEFCGVLPDQAVDSAFDNLILLLCLLVQNLFLVIIPVVSLLILYEYKKESTLSNTSIYIRLAVKN